MMHNRLTNALRWAGLAAVAAFHLSSSSVTVEAQSVNRTAKERLIATAVNMSNVGRPNPTRLEIVIERWSSERERDELIATLKDKGSDALLKQLQDLPRVGYIRDANRGTLGWDLHFARERKLEDGGRQIVLATDRPISAWEAFNRPRSADYEFTLADIRFDGDGKGVGKLAVAAKVTTNPATGVIEIENFSSEPVRLTEVTSSAAAGPKTSRR
jgi:hypothetical protein